MVKQKTQFICQQCGATYSKWSGRCENCGEWNTLVEQKPTSQGKSVVDKSFSSGKSLDVTKIGSVKSEEKLSRLGTGFSDFDTVLGGGILPGGVILLAGQPGIGKSTLLLQVTNNIARKFPVLYVSGEESASQVGLRAERLGAKDSDMLDFASSTSANDIAATIRTGNYNLFVVDSIQTIGLEEITSSPGTVSQITNSSNAIIRAAKETGTAVVLVGHVTKEGAIAGPKVLEHLVDVVLHFEGDRYGGFKILRAVKNRYGSTSEAVIFEIEDSGLKIVENPSAALLAERRDEDGSVVLATLEGNRPLLVEIQALVGNSSYGYPKRTASGFDLNRLGILIAIIERRTKLKLSDKDVFLNVVGGIKLNDPAADLAVCMAIASAAAERRIKDKVVVFGEVGLGGEVRSVTGLDRRIAEAKKMGFIGALAPNNKKNKYIIGISDIRNAFINHLEN